MSTKDTGGPAFPVVHAIVPQPGHYAYTPEAQPGMTLRDYFASKALQAIVASTGYTPEAKGDTPWHREKLTHSEWSAKCAYIYADAMLAERSK